MIVVVVGFGMTVDVRAGEVIGEIVNEPRQRAERGPGERDEGAPCDTRSPPASGEHWSFRGGSNGHLRPLWA